MSQIADKLASSRLHPKLKKALIFFVALAFSMSFVEILIITNIFNFSINMIFELPLFILGIISVSILAAEKATIWVEKSIDEI